MTDGQAIEIQQHLIQELNSTGFGDLVQDTLLYLQDQLPENETVRPRNFLLQFLEEMIYSIQQISNDNYGGLLERLNAHLTNENKPVIQSLSVERVGTQGETFDLRALPSYARLTANLRRIRSFLAESNNNN
jgi:hypothetical protein